jgi:hypothetical protein
MLRSEEVKDFGYRKHNTWSGLGIACIKRFEFTRITDKKNKRKYKKIYLSDDVRGYLPHKLLMYSETDTTNSLDTGTKCV